MKGHMVQILGYMKAKGDKSSICTLSVRFQQMLEIFAKKNISEDVAFMNKCLVGLVTALNDNRCNSVLESRLFAFGSTGKPLPVYQLRTDVLNPRASPF